MIQFVCHNSIQARLANSYQVAFKPGSVLAFVAALQLAFCCLSLVVVALSGFSLLLMPTIFHRPRAEAKE